MSVPYTKGFYVARYFCLAYNNANTLIDVKKAPFLVGSFTTKNICRPKKGQHCDHATTVQSGVTGALTDSRKQTTYCCLNTLHNAGVNGKG